MRRQREEGTEEAMTTNLKPLTQEELMIAHRDCDGKKLVTWYTAVINDNPYGKNIRLVFGERGRVAEVITIPRTPTGFIPDLTSLIERTTAALKRNLHAVEPRVIVLVDIDGGRDHSAPVVGQLMSSVGPGGTKS